MSVVPQSATIIGSPVSPYVRKVLTACEMKGVPYRLDPIVPFFGDDRFGELSPLRRIPVFIDERVSLCDSTVISEYLEDRYRAPRMLPATPELRARARWLEEFADTRMGDVFVWRIFYEAVILPFIFQKPRNKKKIEMAVAEQLPEVMAYLEKLAPGEGFLCGEMSMGDIAVAVHFSNLRWARIEVEKDRWPKTCAWVDRTQATPALAKVTRLGEMLVQTPPGGHHAALANLGVPLTETTLATDTPRRGPMSVE